MGAWVSSARKTQHESYNYIEFKMFDNERLHLLLHDHVNATHSISELLKLRKGLLPVFTFPL